MASLDGELNRPVTKEGGYLSPIFAPDGHTVYALKDGFVQKIPVSGGLPESIKKVSGAEKLVGFDKSNPQEILILLKNPSSPLVSLFLKDRSVQNHPYDSNSIELQRAIGKIRNQDRDNGAIKKIFWIPNGRKACRASLNGLISMLLMVQQNSVMLAVAMESTVRSPLSQRIASILFL